MYRKAKLFGADDVARDILKEEEPYECKKLGRSRRINFVESVWERERERIYKEVLRDKFALTENREKLLDTGDLLIVEASPYDTIWGIGMGEYDEGVEDSRNWKGLNLLGKVLTELREEIKEKEEPLNP